MASSIINTNIAATRTHNVYNRNNEFMNAAMTRVATGMKINSAKDGASTWAISEKMRERIRANDQANQNVQNDTALIKTAQGGISNTIDILKTLKERAINAANDSNLNEDRARIAVEVDQLVKQIDDNVKKVKFNGRTLLDGALTDTSEAKFTPEDESGGSSDKVTTATTAVTMADITTSNAATHAVYESGAAVASSATTFKEYDGSAAKAATNVATVASGSIGLVKLVNMVDGTSTLKNSEITDAQRLFAEGDTITLNFTLDGTKYSNTYTVTANSTISDLLDKGLDGNGVNVQWAATGTPNYTDTSNASVYATSTTSNTALNSTALKISTASKFGIIGAAGKELTDVSLSITGENSAKALTGLLGTSPSLTSVRSVYLAETPTATSQGLTFYVGGEANFGLTFGINAMDSTTLGISDLANSMKTKDKAVAAIKTIDDALATALNEQTKLGAWESRLGYTSDNLITMNENLEAADSAMRDADIAKEMTTYMKYAVLGQASQYMLAQAGQNAYQVLNLLQQ